MQAQVLHVCVLPRLLVEARDLDVHRNVRCIHRAWRGRAIFLDHLGSDLDSLEELNFRESFLLQEGRVLVRHIECEDHLAQYDLRGQGVEYWPEWREACFFLCRCVQ